MIEKLALKVVGKLAQTGLNKDNKTVQTIGGNLSKNGGSLSSESLAFLARVAPKRIFYEIVWPFPAPAPTGPGSSAAVAPPQARGV